MKRVTIKDVAKEAGVSITTVSHSLSGGGVVKKETRERILRIAQEMNYIPDWSGSSLKGAKTSIIGLYVESIRGYYGQLADSMYEECLANGYELDVIIAKESSMVLKHLLSRRVDGAVILHDRFSDDDAQMIMDTELPTVFLDREIAMPHISSVLFASYDTGRMAAEYLYGLGHRRFLLVKGKDTYDGNERSRGFLDYLAENNCLVSEQYQIRGEFDRDIARASTEKFLAEGNPIPSAVFAANDESVLGCIQAFSSAGYTVPQDLSVMGCDNIELAQWYQPAVTSVDTGISRQGVEAIRELIRLINNNADGRVVKLPGRIIKRGSCKSVPCFL